MTPPLAPVTPPRSLTRDGFTETLLLLPRCYQLNDHAQLYTHVLGEGALSGAPPPLAWPTIANFNQLMKVFGLGLGLGVGVGLGLGLGLTLTLS